MRKLIGMMAFALILVACAKNVPIPIENSTPSAPITPTGTCATDSDCASGEQCVGQTCVTVIEAQHDPKK